MKTALTDVTTFDKVFKYTPVLRGVERVQFFKTEGVDVVLRRIYDWKDIIRKRSRRLKNSALQYITFQSQ
jgi:hypothetical protein